LHRAESLARQAQDEGARVGRDRAVVAGREAITTAPEDHPLRWVALSNTSFLLRTRFEVMGEWADLMDSVEMARAAGEAALVAGVVEPERARASCAVNLSAALLTRYLATDDPAVAQEVVAICRAAVQVTQDPRIRSTLLSNLIGALQGRGTDSAGAQGRRAALDEAVGLGRELVLDPQPGERAVAQTNLVNALLARAWPPGEDLQASVQDVQEALHLATQAASALPVGAPEWSQALANEAAVRSTLGSLTREHHFAAEACGSWQAVADNSDVPPEIRIAAARDASVHAGQAGVPRVGLPMAQVAIVLLPLLARPGLTWQSRAQLVSRWPGLAGEAASTALSEQGPVSAVLIAEHGRTVIWNQVLDLRGDLSALELSNPGLARQLTDARRRLEVAEDKTRELLPAQPTWWDDSGVPSRSGPIGRQVTVTQRHSESSGLPSHSVDRRMALAREWESLVEQVREIEGFEDFLRPPTIDQLLPAAELGPVVMVNVSRWRCDALIVRPSGVTPVALPQLSLEDAVKHANGYLSVLRDVDASTEAVLTALDSTEDLRGAARQQLAAGKEQQAALQRAEDLLRELQQWMWSTIAAPVLDSLEWHHTPEGPTVAWPRLWWCPTGPLTVLPLHTAGFHTDPPGPNRRSVLDRAVSSYTPTLRALLEARAPDRDAHPSAMMREPGSRDESTDRLLHVVLDDLQDQLPLDATAERSALALLDEERLHELSGPQATREAVRQGLSRHRWAHFTCHGDQNLQDPSRGGLQLYDGMLTIAEIAANRFDGDYAGLAACKSAVGGVELLDEAITLAAALHYTGYRHVVATLWSVDDDVSSEVFASMYRRIIKDGRLMPDLAAAALHDIVRDLRDAGTHGLRAWTPFIHIGP
jgi:hypothetical protein